MSAPPAPPLFAWPAQAAFGRVLPRTKLFAFGKPARAVRNAFAAEVNQVVWRYKLAPETVNLPAAASVAEIQVFGIELKPGIEELADAIPAHIDKAIPFPIIFEITKTVSQAGKVRALAAYKRPSDADSSKWVVGDYFASDWVAADTARSPLPVALNLASLYEQLLHRLTPIPALPGESVENLAARQRRIAATERERRKLQGQLEREKQFNRKVEINARLRAVTAELSALTEGTTTERRA